jgi:hypothetical protein
MPVTRVSEDFEAVDLVVFYASCVLFFIIAITTDRICVFLVNICNFSKRFPTPLGH